MKTSLKANLLKHLITKKEEGGFTLIELLVVIIIIGILAAIALPSFLNQANKARQSEAKTYVGSMNRGQQAYRLENRLFANNFANLAIGIPSVTEYYTYSIPTSGSAGAEAYAQSKDEGVKSYAGGAQLTAGSTTQEATTLAILCENNTAGTAAISNPLAGYSATTAQATPDNFKCAAGWKGFNQAP
jgi:type IV pilus assembly protein PilA